LSSQGQKLVFIQVLSATLHPHTSQYTWCQVICTCIYFQCIYWWIFIWSILLPTSTMASFWGQRTSICFSPWEMEAEQASTL